MNSAQGLSPSPYSHQVLPAVLCTLAPTLLFHTTASDNSQTLPGSGAPPIDEGQFSRTFPRDFSQSCLTLVQTYHEGKRSKSDTIKRLARLVIDELERASRAGDNVKEVSSVLCAYLEILNVFDKERAGARQEAIVAREDWVGKVEAAKGQVAATQKRGREDEGRPDHPAKHPIGLELIPFGRPVKLPDDLRLTHELQDNYGRDPETHIAPEFPSNLWGNVLANTFIDFNQIFSQLLGSGDWAYTWDKYEKAVLSAFPHRELELQQYKKHIQEQFLALPDAPNSILQYDKLVRTRVAESGSLRLCDLSEFSSDYLWLVVSGDETDGSDDE
ncbi:hypothetical protein F5888DRAFT_1700675 [Russula emetica]|nr:hypothetical protein F5888DRAFT_1700675 [Russula emetica]